MTVATVLSTDSQRRAPRLAMVEEEFERLVKSAQAGNTWAFDQLYQRHRGFVHAIALMQVSYADIDDVVQEVFTIVWRSLHALREPLAFRAWLRRIARCHCMRHSSRRKRDVQLPEDPEELPSSNPQLADALGLIEAMQGLSEDYQEILILRFCEGYTGPQIAELCGMTHGSVRIKISRGLKQLRAKCGPKEAA